MNKLWAPLILLVAALFALSCGVSGRQLQSLSIQQTTNGQQIQFVATGTFSGPPATVTPVPVMWSFGLIAPPPPQYTLSAEPFIYDCSAGRPPSPIEALAPPDPQAPSVGSWDGPKMVRVSATVSCP
jgi:hypothetical protein